MNVIKKIAASLKENGYLSHPVCPNFSDREDIAEIQSKIRKLIVII